MLFDIHKGEEDGFTMVEVLVVILIIGVLAAIAVPAYLEQRKAAYEAALKTDLRNVGVQVASSHDYDSEYFLEPLPVKSLDSHNPDPDIYLPVVLSDGVRMDFKSSSNGFCLIGLHQSDPTNVWGFSTAMGGLTKNLAACVSGDSGSGETPSPPPSVPSTPATPEDPTEPTPDPSEPITDPSAPEVTGDLETDPTLNVQCFHEMITVTRYFNDFITYRTPESMMLYAAYNNIGGYKYRDLESTYWAHPDTKKKMSMANNTLNPYRTKFVENNPTVNAQYKALNTAMYDRYDYWRETEMLNWYVGVMEEEIRKGQNPQGAPNQRIRDAYDAYVHYFHQWNYIQCGEYAFPGYPDHKSEWPYGPYVVRTH